MITSLSRIMMDKFIDLMCGDFSVIKEPGDKDDANAIAEAATKLIIDYENTVDSLGYKQRLTDAIDERRRDMKLMMLRLCGAVAELGEVDKAKETLKLYGWNVDKLDTDRLIQKIEAEAKRFEAQIKREEEEKNRKKKSEDERPPADEIRATYDKEAAFVMTYFKMQINLSEISASVYANIVAHAMDEIKHKQQAMKIK